MKKAKRIWNEDTQSYLTEEQWEEGRDEYLHEIHCPECGAKYDGKTHKQVHDDDLGDVCAECASKAKRGNMPRNLKEIQAHLKKIALQLKTAGDYETRTIYVWIDNDEGLYNTVVEMARGTSDSGQLAKEIKDYFEENNPLADQSGPYAELLSSALHDVDWDHVAEHFSEYMEKEEEDEDEEEEESEEPELPEGPMF